MKTEQVANRCPKCNAPLPANAPQGLCAKCLLAAVATPTESRPAKQKEPPPPIEAVRSAFPQFDILELIGQGGMGFVYQARQPKLDRFVALKLLPQSLAADPAFAERFNREARVLARLNHPNIVTVHDFGQAGTFFYLLMEFVDGVNLRQAMQAGRFTPQQAMLLVPKICEALQFAHDEGVLHRDVKPENILLDSRGRVKIADFGIAKLVGEAQEKLTLTASGVAIGTPHYMAPEQLERPNDVDQRADIYSLGVVFYEMLTGELPIGRFEPPSRKSKVDSRVDDVVFHALEKEREKRFRTASEVKTSVEAITSATSPSPGTAGVASGDAAAGDIERAACYFNTPRRMRDCFPSAAARVFTCKGELALQERELTFVSPWRTTVRIPLESVEDLSVGQFQMWSTPWVMKYARLNFLSVTFRDEGRLQTVLLTPVPPDATSASEINLFVSRWHDRIQRAVKRITGAIPPASDPECVTVSAEPAWNRKGLPLAYGFALTWLAAWILMPMRGAPRSAWMPALIIALVLLVGTAWFCFTFLRANRAIWRGDLDVVTSDDPPQAEPGMERPNRPPPSRKRRSPLLSASFLGAVGVGLVIPIGIVLWEAWLYPSFGQKLFGQRPAAAIPASKMVLDSVPTDQAEGMSDPRKLGGGVWKYKAVIPPDHTAHILFVRWTNSNSVIEQSLSAYIKTGHDPAGVDLFLSCEPQPPVAAAGANEVLWNVNMGLGHTRGMLLPMNAPFRSHDTRARISVASGRQRVVRLTTSLESRPQAVQDGVELRLILAPLTSPATRTVPSEIELQNYIIGAGLEKPLNETLQMIQRLPVEQ